MPLSLLQPILVFLSASPGSWVYQLTYLLALELAAVLAFSAWRVHRSETTQRLLLATGVSAGLHFIYMCLSLLGAAEVLAGPTLLPPLERALSALLLVILFWAIAFPQANRAADAAAVGLGLLVLFALGLSWSFGATESPTQPQYNGTLQEFLWELAKLLSIFISGAWLVVRRPPQWQLGLGVLGVWGVGHGLHLLYTLGDFSFSGAVRLAELVAVPIWLALVQQRAGALGLTSSATNDRAQWQEALAQAQAELQAAYADIDRQRNDIQALTARLAAQPAPPVNPLDALRVKLQTQPPSTNTEQLEADLAEARAQVESLLPLENDLALAQAELEQQRQQVTQLMRELDLSRKELVNLSQRPAAMPAIAPGREAQDVAVLLAAFTVAQNKLSDQAVQIDDLRTTVAERDQLLAEYQQVKPRLQADMEMLTALAQDLRQPLAAMLGYLDLMLGESLGFVGTLQRKFLERAKAATERMEVLLDDLLRVMDIDAGKLHLNLVAVDVNQVVETVLRHSEALFREKNLQLVREIPADLPPLQADREALLQIFTHLITNMGQAAAPQSTVKISVHIEGDPRRADKTPEYLVFAAADTGGGIAQADQARVFTRIYRADAPLIIGLGDNGMGLAITKALVEAHGGRMWFTSEPGQGTTFYVLLPLSARTQPNGAKP